MKPAPTHIRITQPNWFKRHFEFWQNEQPVAKLDHAKWGCEAVFQVKDHQWKLNTTGFWKRFIEVRAEQSPYIKLRIPTKWTCKMQVSLDNRQTWHFKGTGFWNRTWGWYDEKENLVIEIKSNMISRKNRGQIVFHQPLTYDMWLLMALGWYTIVAYEQQAAASSAA